MPSTNRRLVCFRLLDCLGISQFIQFQLEITLGMFMFCHVSVFNTCMALVPIPHFSRYYIIQSKLTNQGLLR